MLEPWFHIGDRAFAFSEPRLLALAWLAPAFLVLTLALSRAQRGVRFTEPAAGVSRGLTLWAATCLRTIAFLAAVGAASGATIVETEREDRLSVVALTDESASITRDEAIWARDWIGSLVAAMRRDDELSLLAFGREARLVSGPDAPRAPEPGPSGVDGSATNLMAAIDSGASLASSGGAIVLVTDGNQTVGDATAAAESARRRGLKLYPIVPPREQAPLAIEHVSAPRLVREGRDVQLGVAIANRGQTELEATLVARQGDRELGRVPLRVAPGRSVVEAEVRAETAGHYAITVALEADPSIASAGARHSTALTVLPHPRVLLVSQDAALEPLLHDAGFEVTRTSRLGSMSASDLSRYHAVVLGEVDRRDLPPEAQRALDHYVRELGGGLLLAAGRGLLSDSTLRGSILERLLPVRVKPQTPPKKERDTIALFLVVDRSSSMSYGIDAAQQNPTRMEYARRAALALIAQLGDGDQVGAVAFDTQTSLLAPLQPLAANREHLNDVISRLQPSGGTDFKEALEIAARQLIASGKKTKHVILLSDGASIRPSAEHDPLIAALARAGVTVTSIRIGNDKDSFALVKAIAEQTGGTFYLVSDAVSLPNLMIEDTRQRAGREEPEEPDPSVSFRPRVRHASEALGGLRDEDLPALRGFAAVPLKPGAEEWLVTDYRGSRTPILAGWQNGLGRVAVFAADPSSEWQSWGQVRRFWSQLVRWVGRPEASDELRLALRREAGRTVLAIHTYDAGERGELRVRITGRDGTVRDLAPTTVGPRHHELALPPLETIEPRIAVELRRDGRTVFARDEWLPAAGETPQASTEDSEAEPNWPLLAQIAEITGGAVNPPLTTILARAPAERQTAVPLAAALGAAALLLALADIALRLLPARFR
jgi:Ca-activated chloride channel homolog